MKTSEMDFRGYVGFAVIGIVSAKGAGDAKAVAKQAVALARAICKELDTVKGFEEDGKDRNGGSA